MSHDESNLLFGNISISIRVYKKTKAFPSHHETDQLEVWTNDHQDVRAHFALGHMFTLKFGNRADLGRT